MGAALAISLVFLSASSIEAQSDYLKARNALFEKFQELLESRDAPGALAVAQKLVDLAKNEKGEFDAMVIGELSNLNSAYSLAGNQKKQEETVLEMFAIRKHFLDSGRQLNESTERLAINALISIGVGQIRKAQLSDGLGTLVVAFELFGTQSQPEHRRMITAASEVSSAYLRLGFHREATDFKLKELEAAIQAYGPDHEDVADLQLTLGAMEMRLGNPSASRLHFERGLEILRGKFGEESPEVFDAVRKIAANKGISYSVPEAVRILEKQQEIIDHADVPNHEASIENLIRLSSSYLRLGQHEQALKRAETASALASVHFPGDKEIRVKVLQAFALAYMYLKQSDRRIDAKQEIISLTKEIYGPDHPRVAGAILDLALTLSSVEKNAEAEKLIEESIRILKEGYAKNPFLYKVTLFVFLKKAGFHHRHQGNYTKAENYYLEALELSKVIHGDDHHWKIDIYENLGEIYVMSDQPEKLTGVLQKLNPLSRQELLNFFSNSTERERISYTKEKSPFDLIAHSKNPSLIAESILRYKGAVLETILEDQRFDSRDEKVSYDVRELIAEDISKALDESRRRIREKMNRTGSSRQALSVKLEDVSNRLPSGMALVEYFRFRGKMDPESTNGSAPVGAQSSFFGAVVIRSDQPPQFVHCGNAYVASRDVRNFRVSVDNFVAEEIERNAKSLYQRLIAPLEPHLKGIDRLIICPDGSLNFLPFGVLIDKDNRFLAEKSNLYFVASGRDLIPDQARNVRQSPPVLVGDPLFHIDEKNHRIVGQKDDPLIGSLNSSLRSFDTEVELIQLPGTRKEVAEIRAILESRPQATKVFLGLGPAVTEESIRGLDSPGILHFATHGFFLSESDLPLGDAQDDSEAKGEFLSFDQIQNPMHRCGIALSGAQNTMEAWARGEIPQSDRDGILLASEIAELELAGTDLVTLSACSTALGETIQGEGVLGMRRAFVLAGATNVLMTLWNVDDEGTAKFMGDFYRSYVKSGNAPAALSTTQRKWLVDLRKEEGLAKAVYIAGPFVMNAQAK